MPEDPINAQTDYERRRLVWPLVITGCVAVLALAAPVFRRDQARGIEATWRLAREIVAQMRGRAWLVTDGSISSSLVHAAADYAGVPLNVMDLSRGGDAVYCRALARNIADPRRRALCEYGPRFLLADWLAARGGTAGSTPAFFVTGAIRTGAGREIVPAGLIYFVASASNPPDPEAVWQSNERSWKNIRPPPGSPLADYASKLANDCGVFFSGRGDAARAVTAFKQALAYNTNNIAARLNLVSTGGAAEADMKPAVLAALASPAGAFRLRSLDRFDGYVLNPSRWASNGWPWAWSGSAGGRPAVAAESENEPAAQTANAAAAGKDALVGHGSQAGADLKIAESMMKYGYLSSARDAAGQSYNALPNFAALKIMLVLDMHAKNLGPAAREAEQIFMHDPGDAFANFSLGYVNFAGHHLAVAEAFYRESLKIQPTAYAWGELSRVLWLQGRADEAAHAADEAVALDPHETIAWYVKSLVLDRRGDTAAAKAALKKAAAGKSEDK